MNINCDTITAGAAVITAGVAAYAVWIENRRSQFRHGIDLLEKFNSRWDVRDFRKARRASAEYLYGKLHHSDNESDACIELDQVLDFFQNIAVLTRRNAIEMDLAWNQYVYHLDLYFICSKDYITHWRQIWPDTWDDIDWLHKRFVKIENRQSKAGYESPSTKRIAQFLQDERNLDLT